MGCGASANTSTWAIIGTTCCRYRIAFISQHQHVSHLGTAVLSQKHVDVGDNQDHVSHTVSRSAIRVVLHKQVPSITLGLCVLPSEFSPESLLTLHTEKKFMELSSRSSLTLRHFHSP